MKNKKIILWTVIVALIGGIILHLSLSSSSNFTLVDNVDKVINQVSTTTNNKNINTTISYTLSDLAKHNNQTSCWTLVNGKIYDITSFVLSHPAGVQKILKGCGIDASQLYGRVGSHDVSRLTNFVVGVIK